MRLLVLALCFSANGQWQWVVISGKGISKDVPAPHALSYFTDSPLLRDEGNDLCADCTPVGRVRSYAKYAVRAVTEPVGVLAGYHILDVLYYLSARDNSDRFASDDQVKWKFILVQVGPDRYREIFHLQGFSSTVSIEPSRILQSGNERVLVSMDSDGGIGGGCWEGYWWFDRSGPHSLDFSRIETAIRSRVPGNTTFRFSCSNLDLASTKISSWVQKSHPSCLSCDFVGEVTARFRLNGPIAEPVAVEFKPGDPQQ